MSDVTYLLRTCVVSDRITVDILEARMPGPTPPVEPMDATFVERFRVAAAEWFQGLDDEASQSARLALWRHVLGLVEAGKREGVREYVLDQINRWEARKRDAETSMELNFALQRSVVFQEALAALSGAAATETETRRG